MTGYVQPYARRALAGLILIAAASPVFAAPAKLTVDTEVRLGYDLNPFLFSGNDLAAPYVRGSIHPAITKADAQGQIMLDGYYDRTEYLKRYGSTDEYGAELSGQRRLTPKLSVNGSLSYDSQVIGFGEDDVTGGGAIDVNLIGLRRREERYSASGGWEYQISPKDTITGNAGYSTNRYDGPAGNDSNNIGGGLGWKHAINAKTKIGLRGSVYRIDYDTPGLSTLIMQPTVTFTTQLSPTWNLDLSAGVSFSDLVLPGPGNDRRTTGFAANARVCHKGTRDDFCFFGDRTVSASGIGGTVERTQIGVTYRRGLAERLDFTWNGSYARSVSQIAALGTRQYVSGRAGLDWQASRMLKLGVEGRYRDSFGDIRPIKADIGADVYARVSFPGR